MAIRKLWFLPLGVASGQGGVRVARKMLRQEGLRHRAEAMGLLAITWIPTAVWLINQTFTFER